MNRTTAKESRLSYTAHGIKGKKGEAIGGIGNKVNYLAAYYDFDPVRLEIRLTVKSYEPLKVIPHGCNNCLCFFVCHAFASVLFSFM